VVVTKSFHEDSKWAELRHLPLALGYQGAWSTPIKAKGGAVLGTLGIYNRELRVPSQEERDAMLTLASAAADALEKSKSPRQPAFAR
jgi:GAF domain-containing protein